MSACGSMVRMYDEPLQPEETDPFDEEGLPVGWEEFNERSQSLIFRPSAWRQEGRLTEFVDALLEGFDDLVERYFAHKYAKDREAEETTVYRFYDSTGRLLYVGITKNFAQRLKAHTKRTWWGEVEDIKLDRFLDRDSAIEAESLAIRTEHPRENIAGKPEQ